MPGHTGYNVGALRGASGRRQHVRQTGHPGPGAARHTTGLRHGFRRALQGEVRPARRRASSVTISARAVAHGTVATRPSRTSTERRRSSSAQAATTSSVGLLELDNNSSAIRARSSRDSRSASATNSSIDICVSVASSFSGSANACERAVGLTTHRSRRLHSPVRHRLPHRRLCRRDA